MDSQPQEGITADVIPGLLCALDEGGVGVWLWHSEAPMGYWSSRIEEIWGSKSAPTTIPDFMALLHEDDRAAVRTALEASLAAKQPVFAIRYRVIHPEKGTRWVTSVGYSHYEDGRPKYSVGFIRDISDEIEQQQSVSDTGMLLMELGEVAHVGGWILEVESQELYWSEVTRRIHEVPDDFVPTVEAAIQFYTPNESRARIEQVVQRAIHHRLPYDEVLSLQTYTGRHIKVRAQGRPVVLDGRTVRVMGAFQDVTAEEQFRETLRMLAHGSPGGSASYIAEVIRGLTWVLEMDVCLLAEYDEQAEQFRSLGFFSRTTGHGMVTYPKKGTPCEVALTQGVAMYRTGVAERFPDDHDLEKLGANGYYAVSLTSSDGRPLGVLAAMSSQPLNITASKRDIMTIAASRLSVEVERVHVETRLREINQELERRVAERTAALELLNDDMESFAYSVSHDLRAPLRHMAGYAHILRESVEESENEDAKFAAEGVMRAARRMGALIDDLLAFSRSGRQPLMVRKIALDQTVREIIGELPRRDDDVDIRWNLDLAGELEGDPMLLRVALQNLIENAAKYTRLHDEPEVKVMLTNTREGMARITVSDNGVGYDPVDQDKLFRVFTRLHGSREFEGTGIGLATVARIIERHQGRVGATGLPGEGASFWFEIPLRAARDLETR